MNTLVDSGSASGNGNAAGVAVLVLGGLLVLLISGGLALWARVAQRRYFRDLERVRGVHIHDPFVREMGWADVFRRRGDYWAAMLCEPSEPELQVMRRTVLRRVGLAASTLVVSLFTVEQIARVIGYG